MMTALSNFRSRWLREYDSWMEVFSAAGETENFNLVAEARREFLEEIFLPMTENEERKQKMTSLSQYVDSMTCGKILCGDGEDLTNKTPLHHYNCCLGRCKNCPTPSIPKGENVFGKPVVDENGKENGEAD